MKRPDEAHVEAAPRALETHHRGQVVEAFAARQFLGRDRQPGGQRVGLVRGHPEALLHGRLDDERAEGGTGGEGNVSGGDGGRITSYNVCYTKLLRARIGRHHVSDRALGVTHASAGIGAPDVVLIAAAVV